MAVITFPAGTRIYLDANVFIYAAESSKAFPALTNLLQRLNLGEVEAVTSAFVTNDSRIRSVAGLPVALLPDLA